DAPRGPVREPRVGVDDAQGERARGPRRRRPAKRRRDVLAVAAVERGPRTAVAERGAREREARCRCRARDEEACRGPYADHAADELDAALLGDAITPPAAHELPARARDRAPRSRS